jgi:hypothetical protein
VQVWLSGALARPFKFGPVVGLRGWAEAQAAAAAMAPIECGLAGPCVAWVESDPGVGPSMATAADLTLVERIERAAEDAKVRIVSIRPAWALATQPASKEFGCNVLLACRDLDALTLLAWVDGKASLAATYTPKPSEDGHAALCQRVQTSTGIADADVHRVDLLAEGGAAPVLRWAA